MELVFNIEFDYDEISILVDNHITLTVIRDDKNKFIYKGFSKLEEPAKNILKDVSKRLFSLEE